MENTKYKYDVAFSFLEGDELLADQINNLLIGRVSTFIYSNRQTEIAGKDGEKLFNRVFGSQARLVVVFFRKEWGQTPWSRIEETAIRNRAYKEGYDFVIFIPLDKPPVLPEWLPKNRIWIGIDRWGVKGAASVIEARLQEVGGILQEETAKDRAQRISHEIANNKKIQTFLDSPEGFQAAQKEVDSLFSQVESISKECQNDDTGIIFGFKRKPREFCDLISHCYRLRIVFVIMYGNSLQGSKLSVTLSKSKNQFRFYSEDLLKVKSFELIFELKISGEKGWRENKSNGRFYSTSQLSQFCVKLILDNIQEYLLKNK